MDLLIDDKSASPDVEPRKNYSCNRSYSWYKRIRCLGSIKIPLLIIFVILCLQLYHISPYDYVSLLSFSKVESHFLIRNEVNETGNGLKKIRLHETITTEDKESLESETKIQRLPQTIIIGAKKCGTDAVLRMLGIHPYVSIKGNETHLFENIDIYKNGLEWFHKQMPYSYKNQTTVEKTPYFYSLKAPSRIHAMNASILLILLVREPVERVVSDYAQLLEVNTKEGIATPSFEKMVLDEDGRVNEKYLAIRRSNYYVHMVRWLKFFSFEQILILDGDKLIKDPFPIAKKVETFLKLPEVFTLWNFYFNETKGFYCMRTKTAQKCLGRSKGRKHPPTDPTVISKLRKYYASKNDRFYKLIGRNFSWPAS